MKKFILLGIILIWSTLVFALENTENDFSLEGTLELFKDAENLEAFEISLNEEKNYISNLDLNNDGEIDYIKVIDFFENNVHAIVLQIDINDQESQDIAVIEIEKSGEHSAELQIIGDSDVFGENVIVEPFEVNESTNGRGGPSCNYTFAKIVINVWTWPTVRYIYTPRYRPYVSPWRWRLYPNYWKPWRPHPLNILTSRRPVYRLKCHTIPARRFTSVHKIYKPKRRHSVSVKKNYKTTTVVKSKRGNVIGQKTKKTTVTNTGKNKAVKKTTTKKGVKKKNGNVKKKTKTVRKKKGN
jgi:hypothetical protein